MKEYYEDLFKNTQFTNIKVVFLWLDPSDYPLLLGIENQFLSSINLSIK